jgi:elongator complex protein 3
MTDNTQEILDAIIDAGRKELTTNPELTKQEFHKIKNDVYKGFDIPKPFPSIRILERYDERVSIEEFQEDDIIRRLFRKRWVRSLSGVTVISLLTKFWGCPGKCVYCPTFEGLPKSYIPHEPAVMRAELNKFDPVLQIHNRLRALEVTGHKIEKNDIRIIWGTWSFYPKKYQADFIKWIYDAFNSYEDMKPHIEKTDFAHDRFASFKLKEWFKMYESKTIEEAIERNRTCKQRVIGMAIETRPDWITPEEIVRLRNYGVTRVEIWYQTTDDKINKLNKRGHWNYESIWATKMLKDAGFKVVAHMMPNLMWADPENDIVSMKECFENQLFRPDELKIYPMMVTDKAELTDIWRAGWFEAYDDETLIDLMCDLEMLVPEYVRINRTYRDIPASEILHGSTLSNLRQLVEDKLVSQNRIMTDIRSREIKDKSNNPANAVLRTLKYEASDWIEYFMTYEDPEDRTIFSLLRLRIPSSIVNPSSQQTFEMTTEDAKSQEENRDPNRVLLPSITDYLPELKWAALIREIHTFWDQMSIGQQWKKFGQHIGFWKRLISEAERLAAEYYWVTKMAVIAGVWVQQYYSKRWYKLEWTYMIKSI